MADFDAQLADAAAGDAVEDGPAQDVAERLGAAAVEIADRPS